jgi:1-acyl-sn-glycerol-3-phosphate acyltransferase
MVESVKNLYESLRKPRLKQVFFRSLPLNRKLLLWYANKLIEKDSTVETIERVRELDSLRRSGKSLTFISNHLTYADSHIIETMFIRSRFKEMADYLVHIAGQKTYELSRYFLTRSLNTIRVYQPKANIDSMMKKKMNSRALKWAARLKRKGYSLLVFPEGTRTRMAKRFNLKSGNPRSTIYFRSSLVVPLALMGPEQLMPVGGTLPRPGKIRLRIGNPINHSEFESEFREKHKDASEKELQQGLMANYMDQINELLDEDYRYKQPGQVPGI